MNRREFITLTAGIMFAWPAYGQQARAKAIIGLLSSRSADADKLDVGAFRQGLSESGYVEGKNVAVEYRWAAGQYDRLSELASDLLRHRVAVMTTVGGITSASAAKAATTIIPIVFVVGSDPVKAGLVSSLDRPGGNITGVSTLNVEVGAKQIEWLRELLPKASSIAILVNPDNPTTTTQLEIVRAAAHDVGWPLIVLKAHTEREIDAAFSSAVQQRVGALVIGIDAFFTTCIDQFVALEARHTMPTTYAHRDYAAAGGLISYAPNRTEPHRLAGVYVARILKGENPADLPVLLPTKYELVINVKTAKALSLDIPDKLLALADEVIE
jgi:putative tryptophan/tyrosine transport system substrate-binding protein